MKKHYAAAILFVVAMTACSCKSAMAADEATRKVGTATQTYDIGAVSVTATKTETPVKHLSDSISIITSKDIEEHQYTTVNEALRDTMGIEFKQSGGPGGFTSMSVRGVQAQHVILMIDGVNVNDASDTNGTSTTVLMNLGTENIEKIEVVRGPQSTLYGSNADMGVINIITKKGKKGKPTGNFRYSNGTLSDQNIGASVSGGFGQSTYLLDIANETSVGIIDEEKYIHQNVSARFTTKAGPVNIDSTVRYSYAELHYSKLMGTYDNTMPQGYWWNVQLPDPDKERDGTDLSGSVTFTHGLSENWTHKLKLGYGYHKMYDINLNNGLLGYVTAPYDGYKYKGVTYAAGDVFAYYDDGNGVYSQLAGKNYDLDYSHTLSFDSVCGGSDTITAGFDFLKQDYDQSGKNGNTHVDVDMKSYYMFNQWLGLEDALSITSGMRYVDHNISGSETTENLGVKYFVNHSPFAVKMNYGTGFRAPAMFQMFHPKYGNTNLKPETSKSWEFGFEGADMTKKFTYGWMWWDADITDAIQFQYTDRATSTGSYYNVAKTKTKGWESEFGWKISERLNFNANYTYTDAKDISNTGVETPAVQTAKNKANFSLAYRHLNYSLIGDLYVIGSRPDYAYQLTIPKYTKFDLKFNQKLNAKTDFFVRIENVFNANVIEGLGYKELGTALYTGFSYKF